MEFKRGRYSWLLRPFLVLFDIFVINIFAFYVFNFNEENLYFFSSALLNNKHLLYIFYSTIAWLISTSLINFYEVYRYTSVSMETIYALFVYYGNWKSLNDRTYLDKTYLGQTFLRQIYLDHTFLRKIYLGHAFLRKIYLGQTFLRKIYLGHAFLRKIYLGHAFLRKIYLGHAFLRKIYLGHAFLSITYLGQTKTCMVPSTL